MKPSVAFVVALVVVVGLFCSAEGGPRPSHAERKKYFLKDFKNERNVKPKSAETRDMPDYRLPTALLPLNQVIKLQPFITVDNNTFNGYTEITFDVVSTTSVIVIHHRDLNIDDTLTTVEEVGGASIPIVSQTYDSDKEFYTTTLGQNLGVGLNYVIKITYVGPLNSFYAGCFTGAYIEQGTDVYYAMSDFEPTDARNCFPCFDEPAFKATFTTAIIREDNMLSASNAPLLTSTSLGNGWTRDDFETTVKMSTYLNAFHVSDFSFTRTTDTGIGYSIYCRPGFENMTEYALFLGPGIINEFARRFNTPYAMPKLDMIALPEFNSGAMENWGFVTYIDYALLYSEVVSSAYDKQVICEIVSHELAHQWFGNYVTTAWWDNLWLNEGFASYYEYVGCGVVEPTFQEDDIYLLSELHYILGVDDSQTSNPIILTLDHPDEIGGMFNTITYAKGSAMVRMMQYFLTQSTFEAGLETYLATYAFSNAFQDDLFEILNTQATADGTLDPSLTVKEIMDTWTLQMGYPVLTVTRPGDGTATLTQERFLMKFDPNITDANDYKWYIPITYTQQITPDFVNFDELWMLPSEAQKIISGMPPSNEWVIFNIQEGGYFRVNYDIANWNALTLQLNTDHTIIDLKNRAQIINDAYNLAAANVIQYDVAFGTTEYLDNELEYVPIDVALDELDNIDEMFRRKSTYGQLKSYLIQVVEPIYIRVGFEDSISDPFLEQLTRDLITSWACYLDYASCVSQSTALYSQWMADPDNQAIISVNLRYTVYCTSVSEGTQIEWDFAFDRYMTSIFPNEEFRLLYAMGCSSVNWILTSYLDMAFDGTSGIPQSHVDNVIDAVSEGTLGEDIAWDYVRANDVDIANYMGSSNSVSYYVYVIARKFNTDQRLTQLEQYKTVFLTNFGSGANTNFIDLAIEDTKTNIEWMSNNEDEIDTWLTDNGY